MVSAHTFWVGAYLVGPSDNSLILHRVHRDFQGVLH
jgi:hypothetical protein